MPGGSFCIKTWLILKIISESYKLEVHTLGNKENKRKNKVDMVKRDSEVEDKLKDKTAYGEFVSTFHGWVSFEEQNRKAKHIQRITREE